MAAQRPPHHLTDQAARGPPSTHPPPPPPSPPWCRYYGGQRGFELVLDLLEDACQGLLTAIQQQRGRA